MKPLLLVGALGAAAGVTGGSVVAYGSPAPRNGAESSTFGGPPATGRPATGPATVPTETVPTGVFPTGQPPTTVSPVEMAADAAATPLLPSPVVETNPAGTTYVGFPTWLWVLPASWQTKSVATVFDGTPLLVTVVPERVTWSMGDRTTLVCEGPGVPFDPWAGSGQTTYCAHRYSSSSAGQASPDGDTNDRAYDVEATVQWDVQWTGPTGSGQGAVPLEMAGSTQLRVEQIQSIDVEPSGGPLR